MFLLLTSQRSYQRSSQYLLKRCKVATSKSSSIPNLYFLKCCPAVSSPLRTFWDGFPHTRPLYHEKDGLDREKFKIVYRSKLFNHAFYAQLTALSTFASEIVSTLYFNCKSYLAGKVVPLLTHVGPFVVNYDLGTVLIILAFNCQFAVMYIAAQSACYRIYHCADSNNYAFISLSKNPFKSQVTYCKPGELVRLKHNMFNTIFGNHRINNKRLHIHEDNFKDVYTYFRLLSDESE